MCTAQSQGGNPYVGNPINCSTGIKIQNETDFASSDFSLSRSFSSDGVRGTALADEWKVAFPVLRTYTVTNESGSLEVAIVEKGANFRSVYTRVPGAPLWTNYYGAVRGTLNAITGGFSFKNLNGESDEFNSAGKLTARLTRDGKRTVYSGVSNSFGGTTYTVTTYNNRSYTVVLDADNYPRSFTDANGATTQYLYDSATRLQYVVYPDATPADSTDNPRKEYLYEHANAALLTGIIDETGKRFATYGYDSEGRAILTEHAGSAQRAEVSYPNANQALVREYTSSTDYREKTLTFVDIGGARRVSRIDYATCTGCNNGRGYEEWTFDANGNPDSYTDRNGHVTDYAFDATRALESSRTEAFGDVLARTIGTTWHSDFSAPTFIDEALRTTQNTYVNGLLTQVDVKNKADGKVQTTLYGYDGNGRLQTVDGPRTDISDITTYTYDAQGNIATIKNALNHLTQITAYDGNGKPLTIIDPNGLTTTLTYTARGWLKTRTVTSGANSLVTTFDYYANGLLEKVTQPDGSFIRYEYDDAQRLTDIVNTLGERIHYTLDRAGNHTQEEVFNATGTRVRNAGQRFNALNQLTEVLNAQDQRVLQLQYDGAGLPSTSTRTLDATTRASTVSGYDALDRLNKITDALNGVTDLTYDSLDQIKTVTDPKDLLTAYGVNGLGQLTSTTSPDTGTTNNTVYDSAGNLKTRTDANAKTTTYTYDALNRVKKITYADASSVTFTYDSIANGNFGIGRLTLISSNVGGAIYNSLFYYDQMGRLVSLPASIAGKSRTSTYSYDAYGRLKTHTNPTGLLVTYGYNSAGQISTMSTGATPTIRMSNITYFPFGGVKSWNWGNGGALYQRSFDSDGRISGYTLGTQNVIVNYDLGNRITGFTGAQNATFTYDNLDRLSTASGVQTQVLHYDANGNREDISRNGAFEDYAIASTSNRLSSVGARTYQYDNAGNLLSDGVNTFVYNAANRLSHVSNANAVVDYFYNGLGQRVKKVATVGGVLTTTLYAYDSAGQLIGEYNQDSAGAIGRIGEVIWLGNVPVLYLNSAGSLHYIQTDHLNTPRALLSGSTLVWKWDSSPFGETLPNEDVDGNAVKVRFDWRLPGQLYDLETGLHYNYFRDYDPGTGRYVESDPIGLKGGINTFGYVNSNPLNFVDPNGLEGIGPWTFPQYPAQERRCEKNKYNVNIGFTPEASFHYLLFGVSASAGPVIGTDGQACFVKTVCGRFGLGAWIGLEGGIPIGLTQGATSNAGGWDFGFGGDAGWGPAKGGSVTVGNGSGALSVIDRYGAGYGMWGGLLACKSTTTCTVPKEPIECGCQN